MALPHPLPAWRREEEGLVALSLCQNCPSPPGSSGAQGVCMGHSSPREMVPVAPRAGC